MPSRPRYCCVCSNYCGKIVDGQKVSMHRFPVDKRASRVWISRCKNARPKFVYTKWDQSRLCGRHFIGRQGPSQQHPLPVIFPRPDGSEKVYTLSTLVESNEDQMEVDNENDGKEDAQTADEKSVPSEDSDTTPESSALVMEDGDSVLDVSLKLHDYVGVVPVIAKIQNRAVQTETATSSIGTQIEPTTSSIGTQTDFTLITIVSNAASQTPSVNYQNIGIQANTPSLTFDDICQNDDKVMFYTGIPGAATFNCIFDELKSGMEKESDQGRPRSLRVIDEFFLVLMRLRLGLLLEDLADRFRISVSTASHIFNKWLDYLDSSLECLVKWPARQNIDYTMPIQFRRKYPKCRVIIDCTEIRTETPSSLKLKSLLYSDYKSHMTYKSLIGISPAGIVTFVSDLYSGSTSDKQITMLSGLVDMCEEGDAIMVDKGFLISDITTPKGIDLIIPPFKKRRQFLPSEVEATKTIANLRIHVERQMERIKNFRIIQGVVPINMSSQVSKIWKTCVRLTNLQPPLVLDVLDVLDD